MLSLVVCLVLFCERCAAFSADPPAGVVPPTTTDGAASTARNIGDKKNNILILDHLNINHERGRHDWLKAFYFDFLHCLVDPRKAENLLGNRGTVWSNIGAHQFHLPEGDPDAQVLQGVVTLAYPDLAPLKERIAHCQAALQGSQFGVQEEDNDEVLVVTDPWGTPFRLVTGGGRDSRGRQPGDGVSEGLGMRDLTIYCPDGSDMAAIGRFYEKVLGAPVLRQNDHECVVDVGPQQTLTFCPHPMSTTTKVQHDDLRVEGDAIANPEDDENVPSFPSNYGPHVSIYVRSLPVAYQAADALGLVYVNPRFKRRAYTLEQAAEQCMFRILDIVDPDTGSLILKLEHEVRSVVKRDGSMYKSCPFDEIPEGCEALSTQS